MEVEAGLITVKPVSWRVEHNRAGLGSLSVVEYHSHGIDVFDVKSCSGVENAFYPQHIVTLIKRPFVFNANWEGHHFQKPWHKGSVVFIPAESTLTHQANKPYDETVIRLKHELFVRAASEHVDFSQIDFAMRDVTSFGTWKFGIGLAAVVMDESYREWPLLVESASVTLTLALIRELSPHSTTAFKEVKSALSGFRRKRVLGYIDDNIHRQISLTELAAVANLSHYHFARKFKNKMGMTPLQYLADRRVEMAKRLLRTTSDSLVEISMACGFASQSHFGTVFKKVTGTTPASYRFSAT